jgi:ribosomal protein S18 acetylase RimI-like enzyme
LGDTKNTKFHQEKHGVNCPPRGGFALFLGELCTSFGRLCVLVVKHLKLTANSNLGAIAGEFTHALEMVQALYFHSRQRVFIMIEISPVTAEDVEAIARLARIVWQDAYPGIISQSQIDFMLDQRYNTARLLEELLTPSIYWDQIRVDGTLAGFASTLLTKAAGEMKLDKLYIDPARQRLGLGGQLMAHIIARALKLGCHTLILAVNKQNARAIAAYRKNGFEVRDAVRGDIGNGFVMDDFIMGKLLAPAPG